MIGRAVPAELPGAELEKALDAMRSVLGAEYVLTGEDVLEFRDPFWNPSWQQFEASAVVQPGSVEEVQAIVRVANEHQVPLWTTSQARNLGNGGGSPRVQGSVGLNLRRMNRILEINEKMGYAVVEPGVSWADLYSELVVGEYNLMLSCTDMGWGSVIGNSLEHGTTYGPYGEDFMAPCGMEVVLANGDLLRTGMGALPGSNTWHLYRRGFGPTLDPIFMQSNYGIVTKMGYWLSPAPEVFAPFWVHVQRDEDLIPLIDTLRELRLDRTITGVPLVYNTLLLASLSQERTRWFNGSGPVPDEVIDQIGRDLHIGRWTLHGALWEDGPVADHKLEKVRAAFGRIPGVEIRSSKHSPDEIPDLESFPDRTLGGSPSLEFVTWLKWYGTETGAHGGSCLVSPLDGKDLYQLHKTLRGVVEREFGLDYFVNPVNINARSVISMIGLLFDANDEQDAQKAYSAFGRMLAEAEKLGYGEYRTHLAFMDHAADAFRFGDHSYNRFVEAIKDAVDPNGILSPGKQGIWPARYRDSRDAAFGRDS